MSDETVSLEVARKDVEAVALCLALGTIQAMRSGAWPTEAGIWTLGRPLFWAPLERLGLPAQILGIFQEADEWEATERLLGREHLERMLTRVSEQILSRLAELEDPSFRAAWKDPA